MLDAWVLLIVVGFGAGSPGPVSVDHIEGFATYDLCTSAVNGIRGLSSQMHDADNVVMLCVPRRESMMKFYSQIPEERRGK